MKTAERIALIEGHARERMRDVLGTRTTVNGTLLADAAATIAAMEIDRMVRKGDAQAKVDAVGDGTLGQIAGIVEKALVNVYGHGDVLPSGAPITSCHGARVKYGGNGKKGGRHYGLSRSLGGLHPLSAMPDDRDAMEAFRLDLHRAIAPVRARDVPTLALDDVVVTRSAQWQHRVTLPVRSLPGVTVPMSFEVRRIDTSTDDEVASYIQAHVLRESLLAQHGPQGDETTRRYARLVGELVGKAQDDGCQVEMIGIGVVVSNSYSGGIDFSRTAHLDVLDNGFRTARWIGYAGAHSRTPEQDMLRQVRNQLGVQRKRQRRLDASRAIGATGRIDTITLAALRKGDRPVEEVLAELAANGSAVVKVEGHGPMRLSWRDGTVHSSFHVVPDRIRWSYGLLTVHERFPEDVLMAVRGRPVTDVLGQEFMDPDAMVTKADGGWGDWTRFRISVASVPFDHRTGRILDEEGMPDVIALG